MPSGKAVRDTAQSARMNAPQLEAVRYLDGPCLVIAGAGSGKTRVITQKIAHLVQAGIAPDAIAAITFTNKAANEMQQRVSPLLKQVSRREGAQGQPGQPLICTFHSLGVRMLRADGQSIGLKRNFSILDADDAIGIVLHSLGGTDRRLARQVLNQISLWKNALLDPDQAAAAALTDNEHRISRVFRDYAATLKAYQTVDFDDLIALPVQMLRKDQAVREQWQRKIRYLLVDEYQDTNACQYELLRLITGARAAFTAVGDDDQSIYGWRGATLENLKRLGDDYPELKVITLTQNYRSSQTILGAANALISSNPKLHEKKLFSELGIGDPVRVVVCKSDEEEAESVVMKLAAMKFERRANYSDFAVLYRGNHQCRVFEKALRNESIPYQVSGGQSFFERAEIRDLLAYLRLLVNDDDDPALIRAVTTPRRGVGNTTLTSLGEYASRRHCSMFAALFETGFDGVVQARQVAALRTFGEFINRIRWRADREPAGQVLDDLIDAIDYRSFLFGAHEDKVAAVRWQNTIDFVDWVKKRAEDSGSNLLQIAQTIALLTQLDDKEKQRDTVRLSTIHAAKGLEFPHVFIVGVEEGMLPHTGADNDDESGADEQLLERIEEERRLMYVAVTRAQRTLHLSWCQQRKRARQVIYPKPSRFLAEMQLDARPEPSTTITGQAARGRLGALRELLGGSDAAGPDAVGPGSGAA